MANNDSFFDLELGDNLSTHLRKFSEITDKKEAAAALDEQILAYRNEARSVSWAKKVIDLREEVMAGYTELLVFSKEKDTLVALYNEANAYLAKLSQDKINAAKQTLDKLEKAKRTVTWCGKVEELWDEVSSWTKAEQSSSGCKARLEDLMQEFDPIREADALDDAVAKLEKVKNKDEAWCDKVDALAPKFNSSFAKYITCEEAYKVLQKQAVDVRRAPIVEEYSQAIATIGTKETNDTLVRLYRRLDKEREMLDFSLSAYIRDFDLSWKKVKDKVDAYEKAKQAAADHHANLRQTFKQYLYREEEDGSIFIGRYKGEEEVVTLPEGVREIGAGAFAGNDTLTELNLPDSLEKIGEGAFSDCSSLAFVSFGAGLLRVEAEAFFACTALTSISLPRSVQFVGDKAFANCTKLGRFSPLSSKCTTGADYLKNTLYLKRQIEEEQARAEAELEEQAQKIDNKINQLDEMSRSKTWIRLLGQVREEVNGLPSNVSVRLRSLHLLEKMEQEAERFKETAKLDERIENVAEENRTESWCKKVKTLYNTVIKGNFPCANLPLLKSIYEESIQLEKDLKQAEADEKLRKAKEAEAKAQEDANAFDNMVLAASHMKRNTAWETKLQECVKAEQNLTSAAKGKATKLNLLQEMRDEFAAIKEQEAAKKKAALAARKKKEQRKENFKTFVRIAWPYLLCLAVAGVGLLLRGHWLCYALTGLAAGGAWMALSFVMTEEMDYGAKSLIRLLMFFLGLGGMIALCCLSRQWTIFAIAFSLCFDISYIVAVAMDDYDIDYEGFSILAPIVLCIATVIFVLVLSFAWGFQDYRIKDGVLKDYNVRGEVVAIVPDGVTAIGTNAFYDVDRIEKVILPDSVTEIGYDAFAMCDNLKEIVYGDNVVKIDSHAFRGNTFTSVYVPAEITDISFLDNMKAEEIIISEENETFHFEGDAIIETQINRLYKAGKDGSIPAGITAIAPYAFSNVSADAHIVIREGVTTIDAYTFSRAKVASITLDGSVETIKKNAFENCTATKLYLGASIQKIEAGALIRCSVEDLTVPFIGTIPNSTGDNFGMIFSGDNAISGTYKDDNGNRIPDELKKVTVLSGNIYAKAFKKVKNVETIVVLGASRIEAQAFYDCRSLTTLYLSADVESLGAEMLWANKEVTLNLYYGGTEAEWEAVEKFQKTGITWAWDYGKGDVKVSFNHEVPN